MKNKNKNDESKIVQSDKDEGINVGESFLDGL